MVNASDRGDGASKAKLKVTIDLLGGVSLGLFLGILVGMSTTPIVSIVITALVALLAAFFGLADKSPISTSTSGTLRLIAFGLSAALFTLVGVWFRTHEILAPSVDQQKTLLRTIGIADNTKEQTEMLKYLRFGLIPTGVSVTKDRFSSPVLYSDNAPNSLCGDLSRAHSTADILQILTETGKLKPASDKIKSLPEDRQGSVADVVKLILCPEN